MNYKLVGRFIAHILLIEAVFMLPALLISAVDGADAATGAFALSVVLTLMASGVLALCGRGAKSRFYARDGMVCVGLAWVAISLLGCLPFYLSREIPRFIDALFEIVSGFTTTDAPVVPNVEGLSRGVLYWRSFSHWLGGMGVLVFLLAVVKEGERGSGFSMHLLRAESPGPSVGKLVSKMRSTALILYIIYILLTILTFIFLILGDMPVFDAVCTAFGTAGTGGFGIMNDSMAGYSPYLQNVCTVFMLLFGVNFTCYYLLLLRQFRPVFRDEELRLYVGIVLGSIVLIAWNIRPLYGTLEETVRHAAFQVSSIITTTGFATTNFDLWPGFSKTILLMLMVVGACAGSTGGGLKVGRLILLFKSLRRNIHLTLRPNQVQVVRSNGRGVSEQVLDNANAYLAAYVIILIMSCLVLSLDGFSITTNLSAVLACFNNIGPGLEMVGPAGNFSAYSPLSKLVLIGDMLAGRLEIFPVLILLSRSAWRRK